MPMPSYPIYCISPHCKNLATYKIAARWSDGVQSELKTYGLVCGDCLPAWYTRSLEKQAAAHTTQGESLDAPGIYHLQRGQRDQKLQRLDDLEKQIKGTHHAPRDDGSSRGA